jgi:hypothetical protein
MKPRVYVETSVISDLTNRLALGVLTAGSKSKDQTTNSWFRNFCFTKRPVAILLLPRDALQLWSGLRA